MEQLFRIAAENAKTMKAIVPESEVELIIVNDSPEEEVMIPSKADDIRHRVITHTENKGIHQARVTGLSQSTGDYILFLDQDDEITQDCLADQYQKIGDADVIVACAYLEKEDGTMIEYYNNRAKKNKIMNVNAYLMAHNQIISPGQCLIKHTSIPPEWTENIMSINGSDDFFLWLLFFEKGAVFQINDRCLYTHKNTGNNLSESGIKMARSSLDFAQILRTIPYVPENHIHTLERSRKMEIELSEVPLLKRIGVILRNADIIAYRFIWKIRSL